MLLCEEVPLWLKLEVSLDPQDAPLVEPLVELLKRDLLCLREKRHSLGHSGVGAPVPLSDWKLIINLAHAGVCCRMMDARRLIKLIRPTMKLLLSEGHQKCVTFSY